MKGEILKTQGRGYLRKHSLGAGRGTDRDNGVRNIGLRLGFEEALGHRLQMLKDSGGGRGGMDRGAWFHFTLHNNPERKRSAPFFQVRALRGPEVKQNVQGYTVSK